MRAFHAFVATAALCVNLIVVPIAFPQPISERKTLEAARVLEAGSYESLSDTVDAARGNCHRSAEGDLSSDWTEQAQLLAPVRQPGSFFGYSVAIDGDTAVIGSQGDIVSGRFGQGSVYVFTRSGTSWSLQARLTAADGASNDQFGGSVAISGDTIIVGSLGDDVGSNTDQGSAYVFTRSGSVWTQQAHLNAADGSASERFGWRVAISADTAVVSPWSDHIGSNLFQGSAYIFSRSGVSWTQQAHLIAADGEQDDNFGMSVGISGDTVVIGAIGDEVGSNEAQGSAYIFTRSGAVWTEQAKLISADGAEFDRFGRNVAISGDTVVVGVDLDQVGTNVQQGSAYVFTRTAGVWTQQAHLTAADGSAGDGFGYSLAIDGDTVVVGSYGDDVGSNPDQGSAYVFTRAGGSWTELEQLAATVGRPADLFGHSVAISGNKIAVGAPFYDAPFSDEGAAYIFTGPLAPTAAGVSISGRVEALGSFGLKGAVVRMTDGQGNRRTAISSAFGYYRFEDVPVGETYIVEVHSKRYIYAPRVFLLLDELSELNFRPEP